MRAVLQRVKFAKVSVNNEIVSKINDGILVLVGISNIDNENDIKYIVDKILNCRIFSDDNGKMNLSLIDKNFQLLVVSQFTLYGDARKGRRPSFSDSAPPGIACDLFNKLILALKTSYNENFVKTGIFQEDMKVELLNDGPVTILLDSEKKF